MEENREQNNQPEGELKLLRDRSGKDELSGELKRTLLGGVNRGDVVAYVERLRSQWLAAEQNYKAYITDLSREKEALRQERDVLEARVTEQLAALEQTQADCDPVNHPQVQQLYEQALQAQDELTAARSQAEEAQSRCTALEEQLERLMAENREERVQLQQCSDLQQAQANSAAAAQMEQRCAQYEATIATLNDRVNEQLYELSEAAERFEDLSREADRQQAELRAQVQESTCALQAELEAARTQLDHAQAEAERATLRLADAKSDAEAARAQLREQAAAAQALREQARADARERIREQERITRLEAENKALSTELNDVSAVICGHLKQIEDARLLNARLKESLNSLLTKAEALIRENEMLSAQLKGERERSSQYQAIHERLVDMLSRVRMASQMLTERMADVDRAMNYNPSRGMPMPPATGSHRLSMEPISLDGGGSSALFDMVQELNSIQSTLSQMQTTQPQDEIKPNIRYSVEKLEVDCPTKKDGEADTFRVNGLGEFAPRNRQRIE